MPSGRAQAIERSHGYGLRGLGIPNIASSRKKLVYMVNNVPQTVLTGCFRTNVPHYSGEKAEAKGRVFHVPRSELFQGLQVLSGNRRLRVAAGLREGDALRRELQRIREKRGATGRISFVHPDDGHDDLCIAVGLCVWYAECGISRSSLNLWL